VAAVPYSIRERRIFVDSGAYFALLNQRDAWHSDAITIIGRIADQRLRQFTTNAIVIECHGLILSALGRIVAERFIRDMERSSTVVVRCRASDEERAKQIIFEYDDKDFSFTDALSFAVMERLGIQRAFTFDRHYSQFGWNVLA
jgi:predicted nucleic acid-binding protein